MLVVFVAPIFSPAASQMIEAAVLLPNARIAVIAQQSLDALDPHIAGKLVGHWRVGDVTNTEHLLNAVQMLQALLGPVSRCFSAFEQTQVPLAHVREMLGIPGISSEGANNFRDKARMKDVLRAAKVPVARHQLLTSHSVARQFVAQVGFPIVVKPPAGAGAIATARIEDENALDIFLRTYPRWPRDPMLAEEFLLGTEHSIETVSVKGKALWHSITHYYPTPLQVLENPWIQWGVVLPREIDEPEYQDIRDVNDRALTALGMYTGVSHCEWFRRDDGTVAISEIAARPPGAQITTMISRAHDIDFVKAWMNLMVHGTFDVPTRKYAVATAYLRGQGTGQVQAVHGMDVVERDLGSMICDRRLPTIGQVPTGSYEGEGFIVMRHPDTATVTEALQHVVSTVRVQLA